MNSFLQKLIYLLRGRWMHLIATVGLVISVTALIALSIKIYSLENTLLPDYQAKLERKMDERISAINQFLTSRQENAYALARDPRVIAHVASGSDENISTYLLKKKINSGFENLLLINEQSKVIFTTNKKYENLFLHDEALANTPLRSSYLVSSMTLTRDFSDLLMSPVLKEPAFFITIPLINKGKLIGALAYQINEDELTNLGRDYLDLGNTGEIVLTVRTGNDAMFITPTRLDPEIRFTRKSLFEKGVMSSTQRATRGERGRGIVTDYLGNEVIAAWAFIPRVNWGIVVKINLSEARAPLDNYYNCILLASISAIVFALLNLAIYRKTISRILRNIFPKSIAKFYRPVYLFATLFLLFGCLLISAIVEFKHDFGHVLDKSREQAIDEVNRGIAEMELGLNKVERLGNFLAEDLATERLITNDIKRRLRQEIIETEGIVSISIAYAPYRYQSDRKLYAPGVLQLADGALKDIMLDDYYDYSSNEEGSRSAWFTKAMENKNGQWVNPTTLISDQRAVIYSKAFFYNNDPSPAGVIAITYKVSEISGAARNIEIGHSGFTYIIAEDGTFIYHPLRQNVEQKLTLFQFAEREGDDELARFANEVRNGKPLLANFYNKTTQSDVWMYSQPMTSTGWTVITVFKDSEIGLTASEIRHHIFMIIGCAMMVLVFMLATLCCFYRKDFITFLIFSNAIFFSVILVMWIVIYVIPENVGVGNIRITDQSGVKKFINRQIEEAERKNEPAPVIIPAGIEIYSIEQTSPKEVTFSGYIWHRYHREIHKGVLRSIRVPQAINFTLQREITITEGEWDIVGMDVNVTLYQEHDYTFYPFDQRRHVISLEHADLTKNAIIVPDVESYVDLRPKTLPGINTSFNDAKISTQKTYFDFVPYHPDSDLGVRSYFLHSDQFRLAYNIVMADDISGPFIYFFLPLLVILISIFAVLMLEQRQTDPYALMGPFTGLFFALVLLHRSLNESAPSVQVLYMEYAFFFTYLTLIILVIHSMLVQRYSNNDYYQDVVVKFLKAAFWPFQLVAWIITTFLVFY